jgi:hypothetical protein
MSDRLAALVMIVVAILAAAQVGLVSARRNEASALRRRLGDVQARCEGAELGYKKELQAAHVRIDWLQSLAERRGGEAQRLRSELDASRKTLALLQVSATGAQTRLDEFHSALDGAPGALRVELVATGDLNRLVAQVTNASGVPVDVLEVSGLLWMGGRSDGSGYSAQGSQLAAGTALELFQYQLFPGEPERVRGGTETLRAALCLVWLPTPESSEWLDTYWFEYRSDSEDLELVRHDGAPVGTSARGCDLQAATPPW